LAKDYNDLAKQMSVTTQEIANASVEFYRQGLSDQQVMERLQATTKYAKISNMDFNESAKILTATVNSMGIEIGKASDIFAYIGDATASGADEVGRSIQKMGGTADALNIPLEKAASWVGTLSAKTREGAEEIGNSLKAIMARYQQLRERGFSEEDGMAVNQVAKALGEVNIQIMDSEGNFRNFATVMDELGAKWESLSNREQAYIATSFAG
jgi:TP901 family phage tail tape measure protein